MNKTIIERDKTGANPLFYCVHNEKFYYASNVRELLNTPDLVSSGFKPRIDNEGIAAIALLGPGRPKGNAVFAGIKELSPGERAEFADGKLTVSQYWKPLAKEHTESFAETSEHIRELITNSVKRCLNDNSSKKCLFLSGGLDSSIIGGIMKESGFPITSYSLDHAGNSDNFKAGEFQPTEDAPFVAEMQSFLHSEHHNVILTPEMLLDSLRSSVIARGFPGMADVDSSLYLFCEEVCKSCGCALSGECADELFGGYRWYYEEELLNQENGLFPWMQCVNERAELLREGVLGGIEPTEYIQKAQRNITDDTIFLESDDLFDRKRREMFYLNYYGFMQTLSERNFTMSKAHGLRILAPFNDPEIAEYAYNIPWDMKSYKGREKGLLRYAFGDLLPESVAWRKKSPFPKTHNPEYLKLVSCRLRQIINKPDCRITEIYDKKKLNLLIESNGSSFTKNWFGQLMSIPQIFAYLIQVEYWLREFDVTVAI